jgi:hypothetical protein
LLIFEFKRSLYTVLIFFDRCVVAGAIGSVLKAVFATPAQQPGCAPGLQAALFAHLARLGARPREAKKVLSAWLPGNAARVRFPGARLRAAHAGRFHRLPRVDGVAGAGSRGKVKLPRAREGEVRRNLSRLYMVMAHPLSPVLPARCCSTPS